MFIFILLLITPGSQCRGPTRARTRQIVGSGSRQSFCLNISILRSQVLRDTSTGLDSDRGDNGINGNCLREENCFKTMHILLSTTFSDRLSSIKHARERHLHIPVLCTVGERFKRSFSKRVRYKSLQVVRRAYVTRGRQKKGWIIQICVSMAAVRQEH